MTERLITPHLQRLAKQYPVVTLTGPRQAGKTTLCQQTFAQYDYVNLETLDTRQYAINDPRGFLAQFTHGVILDEIQRAPDLPSYIQEVVDQQQQAGQFILTGSQQFEIIEAVNQSLAGRTAILKLLPFAVGEIYPEKLPSLEEVLYTGFYPRIFQQKLNPSEALAFYLTTYVERDIRQVVNIRNLASFERFLKICAANIGQLANYSRIGNDCGVDQKTVEAWLTALEASFIIYRLPPHFKNFRKRVTKSTKLYFYDVGLAAYLLGIDKVDYLTHHPLRGALFENFIISEFVKNRYNQVKESNVYFFRDQSGNEVDLLLDYGDKLISIEIKSGKTVSRDFFKGLNYYQKLSEEMNTRRILIYAGEQQSTQSGVEIYPYQCLSKLFSTLPN
jgi:predicted AAA+ superfamily ATPase